ncbi:hypothetical protein [Parendozoicomonas sp. Alg238-R29]|uniref:hypothetical protein n=1 Tax=Parendozoicomonas sp. Alg238-R29 TaxID=2993446 RepID=UPI00248DB8DD|nr:hypothetical protein [Parendozoicomonas sp. Alg238-R29]
MNCRPALLALGLSNGHLMTCQLNRSDAHTLTTLNQWYGHFFDALALVQKGDLDYIAGRGVIALHRDQGEPWQECQPRFYRSLHELQRLTSGQNPRTYLFASPTARKWSMVE